MSILPMVPAEGSCQGVTLNGCAKGIGFQRVDQRGNAEGLCLVLVLSGCI